MYTTAGNLIHEVNPDLLIICEGLKYAGDLTSVASHPVRLERADKVVYSMHDYSWFHPKGQPQAAYIEEWNERRWVPPRAGELAPLWIGEFGTDTGSLANFGLDPTSQVGNAGNGLWWNNFKAWVTEPTLTGAGGR